MIYIYSLMMIWWIDGIHGVLMFRMRLGDLKRLAFPDCILNEPPVNKHGNGNPFFPEVNYSYTHIYIYIIYTYIRTYVHTYKHTYKHTYIHRKDKSCGFQLPCLWCVSEAMLFVDASPCMLRFVRGFDLTTKMELTWVEYRKMHDHAGAFNFHCETMKGWKKMSH